MGGKHLNCAKLQSHLVKLRKRNPCWKWVGSQAVQESCQRIEKADGWFFKPHKKGVRPPDLRRLKSTIPAP
jgi:putative transposase